MKVTVELSWYDGCELLIVYSAATARTSTTPAATQCRRASAAISPTVMAHAPSALPVLARFLAHRPAPGQWGAQARYRPAVARTRHRGGQPPDPYLSGTAAASRPIPI